MRPAASTQRRSVARADGTGEDVPDVAEAKAKLEAAGVQLDKLIVHRAVDRSPCFSKFLRMRAHRLVEPSL